MEWFTDELLFRGGVVMALFSLVSAGIYLLFSHRGKKKLNARLDEEYGRILETKQEKS